MCQCAENRGKVFFREILSGKSDSKFLITILDRYSGCEGSAEDSARNEPLTIAGLTAHQSNVIQWTLETSLSYVAISISEACTKLKWITTNFN